MRIFLLLIFSCFTLGEIQAQQSYADSLKNVFITAKKDSTRTFALYRLSWYYSLLYPDSALYYADKLIQLSTKENNLPAKVLGYISKGEELDRVGSYPLAIVGVPSRTYSVTMPMGHQQLIGFLKLFTPSVTLPDGGF